MHRDLKPDNILVAPNDCLEISDFGLSARVPKGVSIARWRITKESAGSPGYCAPEMISGSGSYGIKSDIFSLGLV
ncbi:hypothetical protein CERSUDRAFT_140611, partial [Gelatoporia subvermispora B]